MTPSNTQFREELANLLTIPIENLNRVNAVLGSLDLRANRDFLDAVLKYGTPEEINQKANAARDLDSLKEKVAKLQPAYLTDLAWLEEAGDAGHFISEEAYRRKILKENFRTATFKFSNPVTLEISACQYFPWLIQIAHHACDKGEILPGRFIRVRNMKEQEADGDLAAISAAMQIIGASFVEQLDTRGSDGSNIHLGGEDTLVGYYGGVGQPNEYALKWLDEYLHYYTEYGVSQVLNINNGTVLLGYLLHRLGIGIEFKISVTLGNDNPYAALWTLLTASLFADEDGKTPLVGLNWSNSTENETIEITSEYRQALRLEDIVRFEHHVTETWKGMVIQPYNRREDLLALAEDVANISAKHEGGDPEVEAGRERPSDIFDYFREKEEILESREWDHLTINFLDKYESVQRTARALTERGLAFRGAQNLHHLERTNG